MADRTLHGNGTECPACALRREGMDTAAILRPHVPCNYCGGVGRLPIAEAAIVAEAVAWAREHYWPARKALWALQNAEGAEPSPSASVPF